MASEQKSNDSWDETKDKVIVKNNAQTIFEHITELENEPKHKRRWIWELLQNETIKMNARFVIGIGSLLDKRVSSVKEILKMQGQEVSVNVANDLIRTKIEGTQIRYAVQQKVWETNQPNSYSFNEFIQSVTKS